MLDPDGLGLYVRTVEDPVNITLGSIFNHLQGIAGDVVHTNFETYSKHSKSRSRLQQHFGETAKRPNTRPRPRNAAQVSIGRPAVSIYRTPRPPFHDTFKRGNSILLKSRNYGGFRPFHPLTSTTGAYSSPLLKTTALYHGQREASIQTAPTIYDILLLPQTGN